MTMRAASIVLAFGVTAAIGALWHWRSGGGPGSGDTEAASRDIAPGTVTHFVRPGDTLSGLARHYDVSVDVLREQATEGADRIFVGQELDVKLGEGFFERTNTGAKFMGMAQAADGFDFPVGAPNAGGYYNAQVFGENNHLGEDWNGNGGGNTDLGDSVGAVAHGVVLMAGNAGKGWGNVVRLVHNAGTDQHPWYVESLYGHLDSMAVSPGQVVKRGENIGTIGTAGGAYLAHLHLEVRDVLDMPTGPGYAAVVTGYVEPTLFIQSHRPRR